MTILHKLQRYIRPFLGRGMGVGFLLLLAACASIGTPDGGPYDETPPKVVQSTPKNKATNSDRRKISILFDEYIKIENASEKVVVSPPQKEMPNIRTVGKQVKIDLYDSLQANTTYTIDFSDAIVDNNEENPMGQYTFSFSTGETIDTMEVSGTVLNAENLEPIKGILVGLHAADSAFHDSLFTTAPLIRVARTNGSGKFTIKGVKNGRYRVYALKDMDGDYAFSQKSETLAFDTIAFETMHKPDIRPDTLWHDSTHINKIRMVPFIHFYPDNLVLRAFLENGQEKHLLKTERQTPDNFTIYFTAPQDSLPRIEGIGFDANKALLPEHSLHNDTITYWITDTAVAYPDTIKFNITFPETNEVGIDTLRTELLELVAKNTHAKLEKERLKNSEEWEKQREKQLKKKKTAKGLNEENPYEHTYLSQQFKPGSTLDPNQNLLVIFSEPIDEVDIGKIHFQTYVDSNYVDAPFLFEPVEEQIRQYRLYAEWEPQSKYLLTIDSMAVRGALGHYSKKVTNEIRVRSLNEYGAIFIHLIGVEEGNANDYIVQLLNKGDKPVAEQKAVNGHADFFYLKPGDYYLRMFIDTNQNGKWDTGEYSSMTQPEEVFYFPRPIPLRARFEVEQDWNFRAIELTKQKPLEITKQKADKEKSVKNRNSEREKAKK